ncbi:MAG TPA: ATP-binding protein [Puia sp.]|nr:ATP-binding protein [Puia sp.]
MSLESAGKKIDEIPVEISYKIIELFSAGLYSSPNKAFEELVSNAYDAGATKVSVFVPLDKTLPNSTLWVCDNGESMDKEGLKQFWKIGSSTKRLMEYKERLPIGRFGIGKLATYILTQKLTLVCKAKDGKYYAVTMNYSNITKESSDVIKLDERELTLNEVKTALSPYISVNSQQLISFELWGQKAEKTWTFAIMSELKAKAQQIQDGRLKWILSTALPINPNFNLTFNGAEIKSSKEAIGLKKSFVFGKDDETAEKFGYEISKYKGEPCVNMNNIRNVCGRIDLYHDSLIKGKSSETARSHGIFLMVRGRLINIDDPLLPGMPSMFHGVFNRVRIMVDADELDDYITSTREAIKESEALSELKQYINRKFDEVKKFYLDELEEEERKNRASHKIAYASASLSRRPIFVTAKKYFDGELSQLVLTRFPEDLTETQKNEVLTRLEADLLSEKGIIQNVEWVALNPEDPIAIFDIITGTAKINLIHPFFANFIEEVKSTLPFQLIALAEILTECFLIETGINQDEVKTIVWKRDAILRELTFSDKPNAPFVASLLQASLGDSSGLEESVKQAFNSLGFETSRIGGSGKPDGKANAYLGPLNSSENYSVTYDAKSTSKDKIKATTAHISGVDRHRDDYNSDYACVVAIDFEGADLDDSAVNTEASKHRINLIRAKDLCALVLLSSPKLVGLRELREFFENCHKVSETTAWIKKIREREVNRGPIKELLETAFNILKTDKEPAHLQALRHSNPELKKHSIEELKTLTQSLERLIPGYISIHNDILSLQAPPEKILNAINHTFATDIPAEFREIYLKAFA